MQRESNHILVIWLLALAVVLAPVQAAVSAIDMLDYANKQTQHCQHDMAGQMEQGDMNHGDCCQHDGSCADNCSACTQCISVHAMLLSQLNLQQQLNHPPVYQAQLSAIGLTGGSQYRPPRFFS